MSWQASRWALKQAPMPKSDPTARLVLAYLGDNASKDGHNAYPMQSSIAHDLDLHPDVVPRVLKRLCGYGLISKDGQGPQGQNRWALHVDQQRSQGSFDAFIQKYRDAQSAKKARQRKGSVHDSGSGTTFTVHDRESGTSPDSESGTSPDRESETNGMSPIESRSVPGSRVVLSPTLDRNVPYSGSPQNDPKNDQENDPKNDPAEAAASAAREEPLAAESADSAARDGSLELDIVEPPQPTAKPVVGTRTDKRARASSKPTGYTDAFEQAWEAYGRRGTKKAAFAEWLVAVKRADPDTITNAIPAYVASTPELRYRKHFERWLRDDGWESAVVPAHTSNGHAPFQNPADQSVYYEKLI